MSEARIIDGKKIAETLRARVAAEVARLKKDHGLTPGLAVVLVGNDPASEIYVRNKGLQTKEAGMNSFEFKMSDTTTQEVLLAKVRELNADPAVHGILVQFPVPGTDFPTGGHRNHRSRQGCRRAPSGQRRASRERPAGLVR